MADSAFVTDRNDRSAQIRARLASGTNSLRGIAELQVQQTIRDTLRNRKEQLLRAAYLASRT